MGQKSGPVKEPAEQFVKEIRRATRRQSTAEEEIRIVAAEVRSASLVGFDLGGQPVVACQAEQVVHPMGLRPRHQRLARKAAVTTRQDTCQGPGRRIGATTRATSSSAPDEASMFVRRSFATSRCRPQKM
jgi:hypothetical protein